MDPNDAAAAAAAIGPLGHGQAWLLAASLVGTLITTVAMLWKTSSDQRFQLRLLSLQYEADRSEREAKARELASTVAASASEVRDRVEATANRLQDKVDTTARDVRGRVEATAKDVRDRLEVGVVAVSTGASSALETQTQNLFRHIDAAKTFTADKADAAYHEANTVNVKLAKLHEAHDRQGKVLEQLLEAIRSGATAGATAGAAPAAAGGALDVVAVPSASGELDVVAVPAAGGAARTLPPPGAGRDPVEPGP